METQEVQVVVRGTEKLKPSGTITYVGIGFGDLLDRKDITVSGKLVDNATQDEGEEIYEAVTIGQMGREAGWEIGFENKENGHRFNFLGIKGVGLTKAGRKFLESVTRPKSFAQVVAGTAPKLLDSYELTEDSMILPKEGAEERAVLGLVGDEEIANDVKNASRLTAEGLWTAESVAIVIEENDRPGVAEAKRRGLIGKDTFEAREVRAYRSPERLSKLLTLLDDLRPYKEGINRNQVKKDIEQFTENAIKNLKNIGVSLDDYPGENETEQFVSWAFAKAGEQAGILTRVGFDHDNLKADFQNFTSLFEVMDLGEQTQWTDNLMYHRYFGIFAGAASLYAAGAIANGHNPDLQAAANLYVRNFFDAYTKDTKNLRWIHSFLEGENPFIGKIYLKPELKYGTDEIIDSSSVWQALPLAPLPEVKVGRVIQWPEGRSVRIRTYAQLIRYHIGHALRVEVSRLFGEKQQPNK